MDIIRFGKNVRLAQVQAKIYFQNFNAYDKAGHENAFTHAYLAALHSYSFGTVLAQQLVDAHETVDSGLGTIMDDRNNSIGIIVGNSVSVISVGYMDLTIFLMAKQGSLWTIVNDQLVQVGF